MCISPVKICTREVVMVVGVDALFALDIALEGLVIVFLAKPNRLHSTIDRMDKIILYTAEGPAHKHVLFKEKGSTFSLNHQSILHSAERPDKRRSWVVSVGEQELYFREPSAENFLEGAVYRVYYLRLATTTDLISAELIEMP